LIQHPGAPLRIGLILRAQPQGAALRHGLDGVA